MFDFLAQVTVSDVAESVSARKGGPRKERNPQGMTIRLFKDGSVYPSTELVARFNLEYRNAVPGEKTALPLKEGETEVKYTTRFKVEGDPGNGFDVIDSNRFPALDLKGNRILFISPTSKNSPKVDLFGSTTYEDDGAPKSTVLLQGAKTFGKQELIQMVEEVYGIVFAKPAAEGKEAVEGVEFVDLAFVSNPVTGEPWSIGKDVVFIPKKISRGEGAGEYSVVRREVPQFFAFIPQQLMSPVSAQPTAQADGQDADVPTQPAGIQEDTKELAEA